MEAEREQPGAYAPQQMDQHTQTAGGAAKEEAGPLPLRAVAVGNGGSSGFARAACPHPHASPHTPKDGGAPPRQHQQRRAPRHL